MQTLDMTSQITFTLKLFSTQIACKSFPNMNTSNMTIQMAFPFKYCTTLIPIMVINLQSIYKNKKLFVKNI